MLKQMMVDVSGPKRPARAEGVAAGAVLLTSRPASFVSRMDVLVDGVSIAGMAALA